MLNFCIINTCNVRNNSTSKKNCCFIKKNHLNMSDFTKNFGFCWNWTCLDGHSLVKHTTFPLVLSHFSFILNWSLGGLGVKFSFRITRCPFTERKEQVYTNLWCHAKSLMMEMESQSENFKDEHRLFSIKLASCMGGC